MHIADRMAVSLTLPLATKCAFCIMSPVDDGILEIIRKAQENKPIRLVEVLNLEQVKELRSILDWVIERMELDIATEARLGPPGGTEDVWPAAEYGIRSKRIKDIDARHGRPDPSYNGNV